jgi:hypothetical protein
MPNAENDWNQRRVAVAGESMHAPRLDIEMKPPFWKGYVDAAPEVIGAGIRRH